MELLGRRADGRNRLTVSVGKISRMTCLIKRSGVEFDPLSGFCHADLWGGMYGLPRLPLQTNDTARVHIVDDKVRRLIDWNVGRLSNWTYSITRSVRVSPDQEKQA